MVRERTKEELTVKYVIIGANRLEKSRFADPGLLFPSIVIAHSGRILLLVLLQWPRTSLSSLLLLSLAEKIDRRQQIRAQAIIYYLVR